MLIRRDQSLFHQSLKEVFWQEARRVSRQIHGIHHVGAWSDGPDHNPRPGGDTADLGSLIRLWCGSETNMAARQLNILNLGMIWYQHLRFSSYMRQRGIPVIRGCMIVRSVCPLASEDFGAVVASSVFPLFDCITSSPSISVNVAIYYHIRSIFLLKYSYCIKYFPLLADVSMAWDVPVMSYHQCY